MRLIISPQKTQKKKLGASSQQHSLQQSLGLACWVVGTEVLVFLHFLLQREQLTLEFAAQTRQRVPDVVGQLLKMRRTQFRDKVVA